VGASILLAGARLFDEGRFFEAHEAWEEHWLVEKDETRKRCLQGLIQIAAAFHKLCRKNSPESAARLFARGLTKLDASPIELEGVRIGDFRDAVRAYAERVAATGRWDHANVPRLVSH
jgi:uncharacterized protein